VTPQSGLIAGSSSAIVTVTIKDSSAQHNLMSGLSVTLSISSGVGGSIISTNPQTTSGGIAQFTVRDSQATTLTFQATVNGLTIAGNGGQPGCSPSATWTNGGACSASNSTVVANPTSLAINGTTTITVTVKDTVGNVVPFVSVTLTSSSASGLPSKSSSSITDLAGQAQFTYTTNSNDTVTFTATVNCGTGSTITITQTAVVTFGSGGTAGANMTFTFTTNYTCLPADNITTATLTATVKDSSGNGLSGKSITVSGSPVLGSVTPSSGTTDASGTVTFTVRSATQGTEVFTATDSTDNKTATVTIQFNAPGTKVCVNPNATVTPITGQPSEAMVITRLLCDRDGPGFGYARYDSKYWMHYGDIVTVFGKTTRVPGLQALDLCIHKGGPTWYLVKTPLGFVVWANANFIRVGLVNFRNLPVLTPPAPPGAQGAPQAAVVGPIVGPPPTH
jgi:adhesin/invasin